MRVAMLLLLANPALPLPSPRNDFVAGAVLWHFPEDVRKAENIIRNYFELLKVDVLCVMPPSKELRRLTPRAIEWWGHICRFCQERGYRLLLGNFWGPVGSMVGWEVCSPSLLRHIVKRFPEVVWGLYFSEVGSGVLPFCIGRSFVYSPFTFDIPYRSHVLRPETPGTLHFEAEETLSETSPPVRVLRSPVDFLPPKAYRGPTLGEREKDLNSGGRRVEVEHGEAVFRLPAPSGGYLLFLRLRGEGRTLVAVRDRAGRELAREEFAPPSGHFAFLRMGKPLRLDGEATVSVSSQGKVEVDCFALVPEREMGLIPYFCDGWLEETYSEFEDAVAQSYVKVVEACAKEAPHAYIVHVDPWNMPSLNCLKRRPFGRRLIFVDKAFSRPRVGEAYRYEDAVRKGEIAGWGYEHGGLPVNECPVDLFRCFLVPILCGARTIYSEDSPTWWRELFVNGDTEEAELTDYGRAFRAAVEFAKRYRLFARRPKTRLATIGYPLRRFVDNPHFNAERVNQRAIIENCLNSLVLNHLHGAKVAILLGGGVLDKETVDDLLEFAREGGFVFLDLGGFVHAPDGREMFFAGPEEMRVRWIRQLCGFDFEGWEEVRGGRVETVNLGTPLVKRAFSREIKWRRKVARGRLLADTETVIAYAGRPLLVFHRIGKGGVYTVLSHTLFICPPRWDWWREFLRPASHWWREVMGPYLRERYGVEKPAVPDLWIVPFEDCVVAANLSRAPVTFDLPLEVGGRYLKIECYAPPLERIWDYASERRVDNLRLRLTMPYGHIFVATFHERPQKGGESNLEACPYLRLPEVKTPHLFVRHPFIAKLPPWEAPRWLVNVNLSPLFNNDAFSFDRNRSDGNFDGEGRTYPAEFLLQDDGNVWPYLKFPSRKQRLDGRANNVVCQGQRVEVPEGRYSHLYVAGACARGSIEATMEAIYASGRTEKIALRLSDWRSEFPQFGEVSVFSCWHFHSSRGDEQGSCNVWLQVVKLDEGEKLKALVLPQEPRMHIFALTLKRAMPERK